MTNEQITAFETQLNGVITVLSQLGVVAYQADCPNDIITTVANMHGMLQSIKVRIDSTKTASVAIQQQQALSQAANNPAAPPTSTKKTGVK